MSKPIYINKKAAYEYQVLDKLEVGIVLYGWEVKSIKAGRVNMNDSFVQFDYPSKLTLRNARIPTWSTSTFKGDSQEKRERVLLANSHEARKIGEAAKRPGYTIVPLRIYINDKGLIKLEIGLVRGQKKYNKKELIKQRDLDRDLQQQMKNMR